MRGTKRIHLGPFGKIPWLPFEALIGFLMILAGVGDLIAPEAILLERLSWIATVVDAAYALGGVAIVVGLWKLWVKVEMIGLLCLIWATLLTVVTDLIMDAPDLFKDTLVFVMVSWAAGVRIFELLKGRVLVQLEDAKE